jgi:hypothetical protein
MLNSGPISRDEANRRLVPHGLELKVTRDGLLRLVGRGVFRDVVAFREKDGILEILLSYPHAAVVCFPGGHYAEFSS